MMMDNTDTSNRNQKNVVEEKKTDADDKANSRKRKSKHKVANNVVKQKKIDVQQSSNVTTNDVEDMKERDEKDIDLASDSSDSSESVASDSNDSSKSAAAVDGADDHFKVCPMKGKTEFISVGRMKQLGSFSTKDNRYHFLDEITLSKGPIIGYNSLGFPYTKMAKMEKGIRPGDYDNWPIHVLQKYCASLQIKGASNAKKITLQKQLVLRKSIAETHRSLGIDANDYNNAKDTSKEPTKTKHCSFRLLNILFSDKFFNDFVADSNSNSRAEIEAQNINGDGSNKFWTAVAAAFKDPSHDVGSIIEYNDAYITDFDFKAAGIDLKHIVEHKGTKLLAIFKDLKRHYTVAKNKFTTSGTHDSDFFNFCDGNIAILYLHLWLKLKPNALSICNRKLPTMGATMDVTIDDADSYYTTSNESKAKKKSSSSHNKELTDTLKIFMKQQMIREDLDDLNAEIKDLKQQQKEIKKNITNIKRQNNDELDDDELKSLKEDLEDVEEQLKIIQKSRNKLRQQLANIVESMP